MRKIITQSIVAALLAVGTAPVVAQSWTGGYVGAHIGTQADPDDDNDSILFDNDLDGNFDDTVNTSAGADAFSPGFCDGVAQTNSPSGECADNTGGADFGIRGGYDWDMDGFVWGLLAEYSMNDARDAVTAFSTTPARYTMLRKVDDVLAVRARAGIALGDSEDGLLYVTGGYARANIENYFDTSNTVNTFANSGDSDADGYQIGAGYEHRLGDNFTVGVEYLFTSLDDDEARVNVTGPAPATNPFLIANANGTDFRRSDDEFDLSSLRLTAAFRF